MGLEDVVPSPFSPGREKGAAEAAGSCLWLTAPRYLDKSSPGLFLQLSPWP